MVMGTQRTIDELVRKYAGGPATPKEAKPVSASYNSAEMRRKIAETDERVEALRRKYSKQPPEKDDF